MHAYNESKNKVCAAYTFDAGPNAVIYTLEEHLPEVTALMLHYYPPPPPRRRRADDDDDYVNDREAWDRASKVCLDRTLLDACDKKGRAAGKSGDVKKFYVTKCGPGPTKLKPEESLIDLKTGLNKWKKPTERERRSEKSGGLGGSVMVVALAAAAAAAIAVGLLRRRR